MAAKGISTLELKGMDGAIQFVRDLKINLRKHGHRLTLKMARDAREDVRKRYRSYATPYIGLTRAVFKQGKRPGRTPGRLPMPATPRMRYIASAIQAVRSPGGATVQIRADKVYPQPTMKHPGGVPLRLHAMMIEHPRSYTQPVTAAMLNYITAVRNGTAGQAASGKGTSSARRTFMMKQPKTGLFQVYVAKQRPVWWPAAQAVAGRMPKYAPMVREMVILSLRAAGFKNSAEGASWKTPK